MGLGCSKRCNNSKSTKQWFLQQQSCSSNNLQLLAKFLLLQWFPANSNNKSCNP